jgi:hypothetical protein
MFYDMNMEGDVKPLSLFVSSFFLRDSFHCAATRQIGHTVCITNTEYSKAPPKFDVIWCSVTPN